MQNPRLGLGKEVVGTWGGLRRREKVQEWGAVRGGQKEVRVVLGRFRGRKFRPK